MPRGILIIACGAPAREITALWRANRWADVDVTRGLGLSRHPQLALEYFRNYRKLVYLAQNPAPHSVERARQIAHGMGLEFESRITGYGELGSRLGALLASREERQWPH